MVVVSMNTTLAPNQSTQYGDTPSCTNHPPNFTHVYELYGGEMDFLAEFTIRNTVEKISSPILMTVGIPGAILSLIIWTRKPMRQSSSIYLATLAAFDILMFMHQFLWYLASAWDFPVLNLPVGCELFAIFYLFIQYMSPLLTLGFTVERYISICFPFRRGTLCTNSRAIKVTMGLLFFGLSLASIQGYFFQYREGICTSREEVTNENKWQWKFILYWSFATEMIIFCLVPISILGVNAFVIRETRRVASREPHGKSRGGGSNTAATTVMLLSVSFYLICACLPVALCQVLIHTVKPGPLCVQNEEEIVNSPLWKNYFRFTDIQTLLNCIALSHYAAKFYIYVFTGKLFRQQLMHLFGVACPSCIVSKPYFATLQENSSFRRQQSEPPLHSTRRNKRLDVDNGSRHESILLTNCNREDSCSASGL